MSNERYPQGKLNEQDEGELAIAIGEENGAVILKFGKPIEWIGFSPDDAMELANLLIQKAKKMGITKPFTIELP